MKAPPAGRLQFVGDTQRRSRWEWWRTDNARARAAILAAIAARASELVLHLGDVTLRGGDPREWCAIDPWLEELRRRGVRVEAIVGNHDRAGGQERAEREWQSRFARADGPPGRAWGRRDWRGVALLLVDSTRIDRAQVDWFAAELHRCDADAAVCAVVVACHHPPFTNDALVAPHRGVYLAFAAPLRQSRKGALFLSGHCHTYERFVVDGKHFVVSGGAGPSHRVRRAAWWRRSEDACALPSARPWHFGEVTVGEAALVMDVHALAADGTLVPLERVELPFVRPGES